MVAKSAEYIRKTGRPSISLDGDELTFSSGHAKVKIFCPPTTSVELFKAEKADTLTQTPLGWEADIHSADWWEPPGLYDGLRINGMFFQIDIENEAGQAGGPCHFYRDGNFMKNDYEYTYSGIIG